MSIKLWVQAARPKTLTAAIAPVAVGIGFAVGDGRFALLPAAAATLGAVLIQIGTNFANDYYDYVRGSDAVRVGPVRVTQAGLIAPATVKLAAFVTFGLAFVVGIYLVWVGGLPIVVIGLLALLSGWAYTGGPFPLAYHGLGDVFVLVFFGPVAVAGTYWVQALRFEPDLVLGGLGVGAINTAILVANNLRDLDSDSAAGKRTLPVLLGRAAGRAEYVALLCVAAVVPLVGLSSSGWPWGSAAALLGVLACVPALRLVLAEHEPRALMPALPRTAMAAGLYGILFAFGLATPAIGWSV